MFLSRLGSLNSLEQLKGSAQLAKLIGGQLASADSVGRVVDLVEPDSIRRTIHDLYSSMKRKKVLKAPPHRIVALIIDGHESHASYRRHCSGCLERAMQPGNPQRVQYYHKNVTAQLVFDGFRFLLDAEAQRIGEGELGCAHRLLDRVLKSYPRAFQVVVMDALYANSVIFNKLIQNNKHGIAVLKENSEPKLSVAKGVVAKESPTCQFTRNGSQIHCWDFTKPWVQIGQGIRIVAIQETSPPIQRQRDGAEEQQPPSSWFWLSTLPAEDVPSQTFIDIARSRWCIENEGFNELVHHWHADHVYRHASAAITNFWLMSMLAYNIFRAFYRRNLKEPARKGKTMLHFARLVAAELYAMVALAGVPP